MDQQSILYIIVGAILLFVIWKWYTGSKNGGGTGQKKEAFDDGEESLDQYAYGEAGTPIPNMYGGFITAAENANLPDIPGLLRAVIADEVVMKDMKFTNFDQKVSMYKFTKAWCDEHNVALDTVINMLIEGQDMTRDQWIAYMPNAQPAALELFGKSPNKNIKVVNLAALYDYAASRGMDKDGLMAAAVQDAYLGTTTHVQQWAVNNKANYDEILKIMSEKIYATNGIEGLLNRFMTPEELKANQEYYNNNYGAVPARVSESETWIETVAPNVQTVGIPRIAPFAYPQDEGVFVQDAPIIEAPAIAIVDQEDKIVV